MPHHVQGNKKSGAVCPFAVFVFVVALVCSLAMTACGGESSSSSSSSQASSSAVANSKPRDMIECDWGYLELPEDVKGKISVSAGHGGDNGYFIVGVPGSEACVARVLIQSEKEHDSESKKNIYTLGEFVDDQGVPQTIELHAYYVNDEEKNVHGSSKEPSTLGLETLANITLEKFASFIFIKNPDRSGFTQATASLTGSGVGQASSSAPSSVKTTSPFWGVWGFASKSEAECAQEAAELRAAGYPDAAYYLTTDWSNLNSEPWYAVTLGRFSNESDARDLEAQANSSGDAGEVYAKYSGEYQGE